MCIVATVGETLQTFFGKISERVGTATKVIKRNCVRVLPAVTAERRRKRWQAT